jgi:hypothetical protein
VALTDSDVYLSPSWLTASVEVLSAFPEAGQVSAIPTADKLDSHCTSTYQGIKESLELEVDSDYSLPNRYIEAHAESISLPLGEYRKRMSKRNPLKIRRNGVSAIASAQDFQYVITRKAINDVMAKWNDYSDRFYDGIYTPIVEEILDDSGYWRLSTETYYIHHLGNSLPNHDRLEEIFDRELTFIDGDPKKKSKDRLKASVIQSTRLRKILKKVNNMTYKLLYG